MSLPTDEPQMNEEIWVMWDRYSISVPGYPGNPQDTEYHTIIHNRTDGSEDFGVMLCADCKMYVEPDSGRHKKIISDEYHLIVAERFASALSDKNFLKSIHFVKPKVSMPEYEE